MLIVDDDPVARRVVTSVVSQFGFAVLEATSGRHALRILASDHVDVMLLDMVMPDIYGIDVLMQAKADPRTESVAVLIMTGISDRDMRLSVLAAGAEELIAKPVDALELRARLRNVMRSRGLLAAQAATPGVRESQPLPAIRPLRRTGPTPAMRHDHPEIAAACWRTLLGLAHPPLLGEIAPRVLQCRPDGYLQPPLAEVLYLSDLGADLIARERISAALRASAAGMRQELRCVVRTMGMCTLRIAPAVTDGERSEMIAALVVLILPDT